MELVFVGSNLYGLFIVANFLRSPVFCLVKGAIFCRKRKKGYFRELNSFAEISTSFDIGSTISSFNSTASLKNLTKGSCAVFASSARFLFSFR